MVKLILLKLFGHSPSKMWRKFGEKELIKFKKAFEELIGVLEKNEEFKKRNFKGTQQK